VVPRSVFMCSTQYSEFEDSMKNELRLNEQDWKCTASCALPTVRKRKQVEQAARAQDAVPFHS